MAVCFENWQQAESIEWVYDCVCEVGRGRRPLRLVQIDAVLSSAYRRHLITILGKMGSTDIQPTLAILNSSPDSTATFNLWKARCFSHVYL